MSSPSAESEQPSLKDRRRAHSSDERGPTELLVSSKYSSTFRKNNFHLLVGLVFSNNNNNNLCVSVNALSV